MTLEEIQHHYEIGTPPVPAMSLAYNGADDPRWLLPDVIAPYRALLANVDDKSGIPVHFEVTGATPTGADVATGPGGAAQWSYQGTLIGADHVAATATVPEFCGGWPVYAGPRQVYFSPPPEMTLEVSNANPLLEEPVTVTAYIENVPPGLPGDDVTFYLGGKADQPRTVEVETVAGRASATMTFTSLEEGVSSIRATYDYGSGYRSAQSGPITINWVAPTIKLEVSQINPDPDMQDWVTVTASLENVWPGLDDDFVSFEISGVGAESSGTVPYNDSPASMSYTAHSEGWSKITAIYSRRPGYRSASSTTITVYWGMWLSEEAVTFGAMSMGVLGNSPTDNIGDPINSLTGNYSFSAKDISLPGSGVRLELERTYNSLDQSSGVLGSGWTANLLSSLDVGSGWVLARAGSGQQVAFTENAEGVFTTDDNVTATLRRLDSGGFELTTHNQIVERYSSEGRLLGRLDPDGQGVHFAYAGGLLASATDSAGRTICFSHDSDGLLTRATLPDGNAVFYDYEDGVLTSVTDLSGHVTSYTYDDQERLESIIDALGHVTIRNVYDDEGRVIEQTDALGEVSHFEWADEGGVVGEDPTGAEFEAAYEDGKLSKRVDPFGNEIGYRYDDAANLVGTEDALGNTTTIVYDDRHNVLERRQPLGVEESFVYDAQNRITSHTDQLGHTTLYEYDGNGNLLSETDPIGAVTRYEYDSAGRQIAVTDPLERTTRNVYDEHGYLVETISPSGASTKMIYDELGRQTAVIDPLGRKTTYVYDSAGRTIKTIDALGHETSSDYDEAGRLVAQTDANGNVTRYVYDEAGHKIATIAPDGLTTRSEYDAVDNLISTTDALGNVTRYEYDANGRQVAAISPSGERTETTYDANGNAVEDEDPLGNSTSVVLDELGRDIESIDALGHKTKTVYDAAGNVVKTIDPLGNETAFEYDAAGRDTVQTDPLGRSTSSEYDAAGQLVASTDAAGRVTRYAYNEDGRQVSVTAPDGNVTRSSYDVAGNLLAQTDANGHTTSFVYDALGRKISETSPDGSVTRYEYDPNGNLIRRIDAKGRVTTCTYDEANRKTSMTNPLGSKWTYFYDAAGNQVKTVTAAGNATSKEGDGEVRMRYDIEGRLVEKSYSDGTPTITYAYDGAGQKVEMKDGTGTTASAYDAAGQLLSVSGPTGAFLYRYDAGGNLLSRTYPNGLETTYGYDAAGQMVTAEADGEKTFYAYEANGSLASTLHSNGILEERSHDEMGRLSEINGKTPNEKPFYSRSYTYDAVGNSLTLTAAGPRKHAQGWWKHKRGSLYQWQETYAYDSNDRLVKACMNSSCSRYFRYSYDKVGNRTKLETKSSKTLYSYNDGDQLLQTSNGRHVLERYSYDRNGNQTQAGSTRYSYNLENKLTKVQGPAAWASYAHDGEGRLASRASLLRKTTYAWDESSSLPELATESNSWGFGFFQVRDERSFTYGQGTLGLVTSKDRYTFHSDSLGSVIALTDEKGRLEESYRYAPYGEAYKTNHLDKAHNQSVNPIRFAGQYLDSTSDFYNMRARDYDPEMGRFLQSDPIECSSGSGCASAYIYADDRPTALVDPSGEKAMGLPSLPLPGRRVLNVTFLVWHVAGGNWAPDNSDPLGGAPGWRWQALNGTHGSGQVFTCHPKKSASGGYTGQINTEGRRKPPWIYNDLVGTKAALDEHGTPAQEKKMIQECYRQANVPAKMALKGYVYVTPPFTPRMIKIGSLPDIAKRFYLEMYEKSEGPKLNPSNHLAKWPGNFTKGYAPVVSANDAAMVYDYVKRVCNNSRLPSGGWMGIHTDAQSQWRLTNQKLDAIQDALNECTLGYSL